MQDLKCSKCSEEDHNNAYFCRCEGRNIELAKQLRAHGIHPSQRARIKEYKVMDEYDLVEKYCESERPCIFWLPEDFSWEKFNELSAEREFVMMNTKGEPNLWPYQSLEVGNDSKP